jgi:hypothetical protein
MQKCHDNANLKGKTLKCHDNANITQEYKFKRKNATTMQI